MKKNFLLAVIAVVVFLIPMACDETTSTGQKMFGGSDFDYAYSIQQTSDGGYIVSGSSSSTDISGTTNHGIYDSYFIKLDSSGNTVWQKLYGKTAQDHAYSVQQTRDGGYIAAGYSGAEGTLNIYDNHDVYIIKLNSAGNMTWEKMYGGSTGETYTRCKPDAYICVPETLTDPGNDVAYSIQQTSDGGYVAAGYSRSVNISGLTNNGKADYYLIKLDITDALQAL